MNQEYYGVKDAANDYNITTSKLLHFAAKGIVPAYIYYNGRIEVTTALLDSVISWEDLEMKLILYQGFLKVRKDDLLTIEGSGWSKPVSISRAYLPYKFMDNLTPYFEHLPSTLGSGEFCNVLEISKAYENKEDILVKGISRHFHPQPVGCVDLSSDGNELFFLREDLDSIFKNSAKQNQPSAALENGHSRLLDILIEAKDRFWSKGYEKRPPKKDEILYWLTSEKHCTNREAEAIDIIIRPDELKKGGNKKLKL